MAGGWKRAATAFLVLLPLLPFVPILVSILRSPWPDSAAEDDAAVLELRTMEAGRGRSLVGPYSRFRFSHPGPAEFYILYPIHLLGGRRTGALAVGAALINGVATSLLAWLAVRFFGVRRGAALVLLHVGLLQKLDSVGLAGIWNPTITVVPFALFVFLAVAFSVGGFGYLPAAAVVASFIVQTHIGYLPAVAACSAAAVWERARETSLGSDARRSGRALALTLGMLVLIWLLPVIEQIRESPGNMTLILRTFRAARAFHSFQDVFQAVSVPLTAGLLKLVELIVPSTSDQRAAGAGVATLLLVALLPLFRFRAARREDTPARVLGTISIALVAASFWSAMNVPDELHWYLFQWVSVVGLAGWGAIAMTLLGPLDEGEESPRKLFLGRAVLSGTIVVALLATVGRIRDLRNGVGLPVDPRGNVELQELTEAVDGFLAKNGFAKPLISIASEDRWVPAAGLVLNLSKAGYRVTVDEGWWWMYGRSFRSTGREDVGLVLGNEALESTLGRSPDFAFVGRGSGLFVYSPRKPR
ncbi:MAG: hypothetical protein ACHQPI_04345 [Thermoanaerobaculia bacterium]